MPSGSGQDNTAPSETFGAALIGAGGRGPGTFSDLSKKHGWVSQDGKKVRLTQPWLGAVVDDDKPTTA